MRYSKDFTLHGYSDASHSDDPNNSRSVSGYLYMFAGGPVTELGETTGGCTLIMRIGVYRTSIRQPRSRMSDLLSGLTFPCFILCTCTRTTWELFSYEVLHSRQGPNTFVRDTILCASWLHRTRSPYLMSRQQISWTFFTKFSDYPKFKAILDKIINFASLATYSTSLVLY